MELPFIEGRGMQRSLYWRQRKFAMGAKGPVKMVGLGTMTLDRQGSKHETSKLQTSKDRSLEGILISPGHGGLNSESGQGPPMHTSFHVFPHELESGLTSLSDSVRILWDFTHPFNQSVAQ